MPVRRVVLSITPTQGVYNALQSRSGASRAAGAVVAFHHRPFNLDRYRIARKDGVVLASHKSFDERLTVGFNEHLARMLGMDVLHSVCLQGYKGDSERRIGIVGVVEASADEVRQRIWSEFGEWEGCFGFDRSDGGGHAEGGRMQAQSSVLAIMNAFHPEEVERVIEASSEAQMTQDAEDAREIIYLTGAVRAPGLEAAMIRGMKVVCVGHKVCEQWGMRFLASTLNNNYPNLEVLEIDEPEEQRTIFEVQK